MTATLDHSVFRFPIERLPGFLLAGKRIDVGRLLALSPRQARVFVDAWREFDGDVRGRLYCSRLDLCGAFEVAAVHAGYSVSIRRSRINDALSPRPNYVLRVSERRASGLRRWGRNDARRPGLELERSDGRGVWCVSVPSGVIVVRRRGYSMLSGNCAMIGAGRKRLNLGNVLADGEIERVQQMQRVGPGSRPTLEQPPAGFDWSSLLVSGELVERLHEGVARLNEISPGSWPPAKVEMMMRGKSEAELAVLADRLEAEANRLASGDVVGAAGRSEGDAGGSPSEPDASAEGLTEVEAVSGEVVEDRAERLAALRRRAGQLEEALIDVGSEEQREMLTAELDRVEQQLRATEDPGQGTLGV